MTTDAAEFYQHFSECLACESRSIGDFDLCDLGEELLLEAGEDLEEYWHPTLLRIHERQQRAREAEANFRYYANCEEP